MFTTNASKIIISHDCHVLVDHIPMKLEISYSQEHRKTRYQPSNIPIILFLLLPGE